MEYFLMVDERFSWQVNMLFVDDLCIENVIILQCFNWYLFIIDFLGCVIEFLQCECKDCWFIVISFLDDLFIKQFESFFCFGNLIFIQDVEYFDFVFNYVFNKEY